MKENSESKNVYHKLRAENLERLKELAAINKTTSILKAGKPIDESLQQIALLLPPAYQYPAFTSARIVFDGHEFRSNNYKKPQWVQHQEFETIDHQQGFIEVFYQKKFPELEEGPFL